MRMKRTARTLLLALALAFAGASPLRAQGTDAPALLAADPSISGPYANTVLLVLPAESGTHLGFVLNRPTATRVTAILQGVPEASKVASPVYFGGPFFRDVLSALVRSPLPPTADAVRVLPDLYVVHGRDEAAQVAERMPARSRFYVGLVVWQRGELQSELAAGAWIVAEPDANLVIGGSADTLWQRVLERVQTMVALR
jgi:putative transcriptional regulator